MLHDIWKIFLIALLFIIRVTEHRVNRNITNPTVFNKQYQ